MDNKNHANAKSVVQDGMYFVYVGDQLVDVFHTEKNAYAYMLDSNFEKSIFVDPEYLYVNKALDVDEVYKKYRSTVNMSASSLESWADSECSRQASLDRSPISRNLRLLRKPKSEWTQADATAANRTISFVSRMRGGENGSPVSDGCPSKRDISLRNWAYNPSKSLVKSYHETEEGDIVVEGIGVPFIGFNERNEDLIGDVFTESTYFGENYKSLPVYFDHKKSEDWINEAIAQLSDNGILSNDFDISKAFGDRQIATAVFKSVTEEGLLYKIIIDRREKYKNLLGRLIKEGVLRMSSSASEREPEDSGAVLKRWILKSIDFTPSPMNDMANFKSEEDKMTEKNKQKSEEAVVVAKTNEATEEKTQSPEESSEFAKAIEQEFSGEEKEKMSEDQGSQTVAETIANLQSQVNDIQNSIVALTEVLNQVQTYTKETHEGLPVMAKSIASQLKVTARTEVNKSKTEVAVEEKAKNLVKSNPKLNGSAAPDKRNANSGAPGFN